MAHPLLLEPFLQRERERVLRMLDNWLRIPSISAEQTHAPHVRDSAQWCATRMEAIGLENVEVLDTADTSHGSLAVPSRASAQGTPRPHTSHGSLAVPSRASAQGTPRPHHPSVYGDWLHAPDAPTVVVYGHHDVQPVEPLDEWVSPPFEPTVRDGQLFARGAVDDKGQVLYHLEALRGLFELGDGRLPVNVKLLIEGEEEVGSPNFESLLHRERERLWCDAVVVSDTGMLAPDVPSMCTGMRGLVLLEIELRTAASDLHSGSYGGAVPNAAHVAAALIAALHDHEQRVTVPGFYDRVRPLEPTDREAFARIPWDDATFMRQAGVTALAGERGATTLERIWARPTAEIVGLETGWAPEGIRTIVPAVARVRLSCRLVADQQPEEIFDLCERWVRDQVPAGVNVRFTRHGGVAPARTPLEHPATVATAAAIERVWGRAPLYTREGGSGPEEALGRVLGAPVVFLGVGLPDDGIHGPNERIVLDQLWRGVLAVGELWHEMSKTNFEGTR